MAVPERSQLAEKFGARLAEARALRELSQRTLGEAMGMSKKQGSSRINRYERGGMFVSLKSLEAMARALDVPVASLLADTSAIAKAIRLLARRGEAEQERLVTALVAMVDDADPGGTQVSDGD